ncbi:aminoacyl-tRNA hydrolase [Phycicoccus sp. CSK15P-2]|uniref:aminoacyl-tRNA hydrolase n=1 Tax=Phycicoccus sp. CSK15P-2 TaxID=2807627 RepID=UPI00194E8723|nr:aminoacyl-tRNA hydrolase [Phycicoccus sp. CSK15P-2]MBM6402699.1 aminoacyl-tRNA hydrolase [Phycicoccus sp. CSK15P-2]
MSDSAPWLVVGLGNPGPQYAGNRHNVGAMVVEELAGRTGTSLRTHKARASAAQVRVGTGPGGVPGPRAVLAVPGCYMNESGGPVKALLSFFSVPAERLVVVHDELDIDPGVVRLKRGGGEGGHNGLRSVSSALGSRDYHRVRVGIGRPPGRMDPADYVLRDFSPTERKDLPFTVGDAADAVEQLVTVGLLEAQQRVHAPR